MLGNNEYIHTPVLSGRGVVDISDLFPGDTVIEYKTGARIPVLNTVKRELHDIWELEFTDGRKMNFSSVDRVYTGKEIIPLIYALKREGKDFGNVKQFPVELQKDVVSPLLPDPYIAGALIMYGDFDDEYINLPLDRRAADSLFGDKYNVENAEKLGDNTVYFYPVNTPPENPITWKEFFPKYDFYAKSKMLEDTMFPSEYMHGTLKTRDQFIRGIFDVGWNKRMFPNNVSIAHKHEFRLKEVQKLLWSMGLCSKVSYDPELPAARGREYRLDLLGKASTYPGVFYDIDAMENFILNHNPPLPFELRVVKCKRICRGWMYNVLLPQEHLLYLDANFLPRVSM